MPARRYQDLAAFRVPPGFRGRPAWLVQLWWIVSATLFAWSPQFLYGWRSFLLRLFGAQLGENVRIRSNVHITYPWKLKTGSHVWIGEESYIYNLGEIEIGSHVAIAHRVFLSAGTHDYTQLAFPMSAPPIRIADEVWLANDVFVGPGVTIGRGAVVGVRSLVLKDLPEGMICYGQPAIPVKPRPVSDASRRDVR